MIILNRGKRAREAQARPTRTLHSKVVAVVHWLKRPWIQRLIFLILSILVAYCIGYSLLVPWLITPAQRPVALNQEMQKARVEERDVTLINFIATDHPGRIPRAL